MPKTNSLSSLPKTPTGITGLDEVTGGGLPTGRPTLICGSAGCGKTLFAMEFLVAGAAKYDEPGVFMSFEESEDDLNQNVTSLNFDLKKLQKQKKILIEHIFLDRSEIVEAGEFELEGLFIRLNHAIDSIGAKRVVIDTIEVLFDGIQNHAILRSEIRRLFKWLKQKGVTAIITGERGSGTLTRNGLEEYVSDCVILLDHRVTEQLSTRRLRIVKYRGSVHGTNEYPFLIDEDGISVLPLTSLGLNHTASNKRISSGVEKLDELLDGKGFFKSSSVLFSGTAGTGKTSFATSFVSKACEHGERCIYISFEESPSYMMRNMSSPNIKLKKYVDDGSLVFMATRPAFYGLEMHLVQIQKIIRKFKPTVVVVDPLTSLIPQGTSLEVISILTRMLDVLKSYNITSIFTSLIAGTEHPSSDINVSSLIDTWIVLREIETRYERKRGLYIIKSRGMPHSKQVREFVMTKNGIQFLDFGTGHEEREL